jgi:hypothetical protein
MLGRDIEFPVRTFAKKMQGRTTSCEVVLKKNEVKLCQPVGGGSGHTEQRSAQGVEVRRAHPSTSLRAGFFAKPETNGAASFAIAQSVANPGAAASAMDLPLAAVMHRSFVGQKAPSSG